MKSLSRIKAGRKALAVVLSVAMIITMSAGLTLVSFAGTFPDLAGSPYETAVETLVDQSVINGYPDGTFKALNNITRAEVCTVVTKAMNPGAEKMRDAKDSEYRDVTSAHAWAANYINYATAMGVINGYTDNTFKPSANVTYNELSAMLVRGCGIKESELSGSWPDNYKNRATYMGIYRNVLSKLSAAQAANFNYDAPATRGDAALMVSAVLEQLKIQGKKDLPASGSKSHIYEDGRYDWIDGDVTSLSLIKAISIMQNDGFLAETAATNKAGDEAKLAKYNENIEAVDEGIQQVKDKIVELQETLQTINDTLAKKKTLLVLALLTGKYSETKAQLEEAEASIPTILDGIDQLEKQIPELEFSRSLAVKQRDFCQANIENNNKAELNAIESQTAQIYYGVLQARENLSVSEDNLAVQQTLMDMINLKYKVGTVAAIEVKAQESSLIQAEQTVKEAKATLEKAVMNFNMLLGRDVRDNLNLTDSLTAVSFPSKKVEEYVAMAQVNRLTVKAVNYGYDMAKASLDHMNENGTDKTSSDYLTTQNTVKTLENSRDVLIKNIEIEVRSAYLDMMNKYDAVKSAKKTVDLAKEGYNVKKLMYENGLATMTDVREAQVQAYQANQLLMANTAAYNTAVCDFRFMVGIGKERIDL